jgi:hypothetical protein
MVSGEIMRQLLILVKTVIMRVKCTGWHIAIITVAQFEYRKYMLASLGYTTISLHNIMISV